jgi:uncharacterized protein (TIGR03086 family)
VSTLEHLSAAHAQFGRVLATVDATEWDVATPCDGWTVARLVEHVVGGEQMTVALLVGATAVEARAAMATVGAGDVRSRYGAIAAEVESAFGQPGALERTVHHPMGDMSAAQLLGFRVGDLTLHSWDLSRSIAGDELLDPMLVAAVWADLEPLSAVIGQIGVFGDGPSGDVGEGSELQLRLLDLTGRRP